MNKTNFQEQVTADLGMIQTLLADSLNTHKEETRIGRAIHDLEKKRTETTSGLLESSANINSLARQRTGMAEERTGLMREQTRLSTRSTELSNIRTELSHERTAMATERTDFSRTRTNLADQRTEMAKNRTAFSENRTSLAGTRTLFSNLRTELARGRTYLALIRTGLAFLSISIGFFRLFGLSWWSIFDGLLGLFSLGMTASGLLGYWRATRLVQTLQSTVPATVEEGQTA